MKKLFLNFMFAASLLLSAGVSFVSCTDDDKAPDGGEQEPPLLEGEVIKGNDTPTPIKCYEGETPVTEYGVQIIPGVTLDNELRFECIPGPSTKSYRLDVIPLAKAYDMIYSANYDEINNGKVMTVEETAQAIKDLLFAEGGAAGFTFAPSDEMTDYATGHEFNWVADGYEQGGIVVPDAEYLIVAVGCSDENGANGRDMSISCVSTTKKDLIGDPVVEVANVEKGWSAFGLDLKANEDAKYYYCFPIGTKDLKNYIANYGEKVFADMIRFSQFPGEVTVDGMYAQYGLWLDPSEEITVVTIGADENYVMNDMVEYSFYVLQKPADRVLPTTDMVDISVVKKSASVVEFNVEFKQKEVSLIRYRLMNKVQWETTMANDPEAQAALINELVEYGGWVERNPGFKLTEVDGEYLPTGGTGSTISTQYVVERGTNSVLAYICENGYEDHTSLGYIEFDTKELVNKADKVTSTVLPSTVETGVTDITVNFVPKDEVALYYYRMVEGDALDLSTPNQMYDYLFAENEVYTNCLYPWVYEKDAAEWTDHNSFYYSGLLPSQTYKFIVAAETWDGELLCPEVIEATTKPTQAGPNPEMSIVNPRLGEDLLSGAEAFAVDYTILQDVGTYYHAGMYVNKDELKATYKEAITYWRETMLDGGGMPANTSMTMTYMLNLGEFSSDYIVAMCLPYGSGSARGELSIAVFDVNKKEVVNDLRTLWGDAPAPATGTTTAIKPVSANLFTATERIKQNQAETEAFLQSLREMRGYSKYQWTPSLKAPAPSHTRSAEFMK